MLCVSGDLGGAGFVRVGRSKAAPHEGSGVFQLLHW